MLLQDEYLISITNHYCKRTCMVLWNIFHWPTHVHIIRQFFVLTKMSFRQNFAWTTTNWVRRKSYNDIPWLNTVSPLTSQNNSTAFVLLLQMSQRFLHELYGSTGEVQSDNNLQSIISWHAFAIVKAYDEANKEDNVPINCMNTAVYTVINSLCQNGDCNSMKKKWNNGVETSADVYLHT